MPAAAALVIGALAAMHYSRADLALAHWDARAHLVVARRILDSLTPGWQQIGAVWLPLPHLLNMLPVQVDAWYRSGASAIAISVLSTAVTAWALARMTIHASGSIVPALAGTALLVANPNILYVQSTPMTEPLLFATSLAAVVLTIEWVADDGVRAPRAAGWVIVAACMTRYEAWPISAALILLAAMVLLRRGVPPAHALRCCARLACYPLIAAVLFSANSRWTTGHWLLPSGFYVSENEALGQAAVAFDQVRESLFRLSGTAWVWPGVAAALATTAGFVRSRQRAPLVLVLAMAAAAALPWYAYYHGHPLRLRYGLPLVVASAALVAAAITLLRRPWQPIAAAAVVLWIATQARPLDPLAPLVVESQRDVEDRQTRQHVTSYLRQHWDGGTIMMSMGSLAHYMHDLSADGFAVRDFLQEGNEQLWVRAATIGPRGFVRWVAIDERGEGGDALAQAARRDAHFLNGFTRVAQGGGVALYRATPRE